MANAGDIRPWRAKLGLGKYAGAFLSNAIDLDVVCELTEADLKDLGVEAMGDRKRLLCAIASLAADDVPIWSASFLNLSAIGEKLRSLNFTPAIANRPRPES
jgi:hypothetical protein